MKRCIIITGYLEGAINDICPDIQSNSGDSHGERLILCADGGYRLAQREGIVPHVIIGDFDTFGDQAEDQPPVAEGGSVIRVPRMKDDTDTMLCVKYGIEQGCQSFLLIGGIGGRLDHTVANLQTLAFLALQGKEACLMDGENCLLMRSPGQFTLQRKDYRRFSLFSWSPSCEGIYISGAQYPLEDGQLDYHIPLGVSNEFLDDTVHIRFRSGLLLVIMNRQQ